MNFFEQERSTDKVYTRDVLFVSLQRQSSNPKSKKIHGRGSFQQYNKLELQSDFGIITVMSIF